MKKDIRFIGQYFLTVGSDGKIVWSGRVLLEVSPGLYYVQLHSPTVRRLIGIREMGDWLFFNTARELTLFSENVAANQTDTPRP